MPKLIPPAESVKTSLSKSTPSVKSNGSRHSSVKSSTCSSRSKSSSVLRTIESQRKAALLAREQAIRREQDEKETQARLAAAQAALDEERRRAEQKLKDRLEKLKLEEEETGGNASRSSGSLRSGVSNTSIEPGRSVLRQGSTESHCCEGRSTRNRNIERAGKGS